MDIRVFRTFIAVADNKHFGRAAETLYITQAAVSARIKQLEEFYAAQLIIREKNNLRLTPSGEALLSHAHLMVSQMEQSKVALSIASQQKYLSILQLRLMYGMHFLVIEFTMLSNYSKMYR